MTRQGTRESGLKFGIIDHMDIGGQPSVQAHYENRLRFLEACEAAGFHGYHVTEHHCTPLGGAASPSVMLAAAAQRTKTMRLGTLVYALPAHHPIRLAEEIGMIDQMSGGRVDLGFGRGSVPMELEYFGVDRTDARAMFDEILACVLQGLATGEIDFHGKFFDIDKAPLFHRPVQKPHPPLWYGVHSLESAERAAKERFNIVCNEPAEASAAYIGRFRSVWARENPGVPEPMIGISRSVFVGRTDEEGLAVARRAHAEFLKSFIYLHTRHGVVPKVSGAEANFDELAAGGRGVAGSPRAVAESLRSDLRAVGANYCVMRMAFGDMTFAEMSSSLDLFVTRVMPELAGL